MEAQSDDEYLREEALDKLTVSIQDFDIESIYAIATGMARITECAETSIHSSTEVARAIEWAFGNKAFLDVLMENYERSCQSFPVKEGPQ